MFLHDLRFAIRQLRQSPLFTLTATLTLSVGIGATTAVFSLVEGILLRDLPFSDPARLVLLGDHLGGNPRISRHRAGDWHLCGRRKRLLRYGRIYFGDLQLSGEATPEQVHAARFTAGVFQTLGVRPIRGRVFSQKEEEDHQPVAVISYALWLTRYHRDPDILGKSIELDRRVSRSSGSCREISSFPSNQANWIKRSSGCR